MNESTSRLPAATECWSSLALRRGRELLGPIAFLAVAIAVVLLLTSAAPVQANTSPKYKRLWAGLSDKNHRWARRTSECESGGDRNIHSAGGTYHGAFQFSRSTWENSPKSPGGDPHRYSWRTQAVVAIYLKKRDGARTHWPYCG